MRRRRGFTLAEALVTVVLIAVLAAVVIPSVGSQIKKSQPGMLVNDVMAIRGGVDQFVSDLRKYPAKVSQLTTQIVAVSDTPAIGTEGGTPYGALETARWRGPYLNQDTASVLNTGWGLHINARFDTVSLTTSGVTSTAGGTKYLVLTIPMVVGSGRMNDTTSILFLDGQYDDGVLLTGSFRYRACALTGCSGQADTMKYLLMPIY